MPTTTEQLEELAKGDIITADFLNALVRTNNALGSISGRDAASIQPGWLKTVRQVNTKFFKDVATIGLIQCENVSESADLEAYKPAGVVEAVFNNNAPDANRRILICQPASSEHFGKWVVPLRDAKPGQLIPAIINGLSLVKYKRLFDQKVLNRVDIWGDESVCTENIIGLGEWMHDEGAAVGEEQFAFIRIGARPDSVFRISSSAGASVGEAVMLDSTGLVGDGIPAVKEPDDDYKGQAFVVVGKDIAAGETGWAATGKCLAQVDDAGDPDDDFGGENAASTLIKDETGFRSLGSPGSTGGSTYIIARPFCSHLIRADAVNSIDEQNPGTVSQDDGTISHDLETGDEIKAVVHFKRGTVRLNGTYIKFSISPEFDAQYDAGDQYLFSGLTVKVQYIVEDFDPALASWNVITGLTFRGNFELVMTHDTNGIPLRAQGGQVQTNVNITMPNDFFAIWHGRDFFELSQADIDAGFKIHGVLVELIPDANYLFGLADAEVEVPVDFVDVEHVNDVGGDV